MSLKIAIDLDGTINRYPKQFSALMETFDFAGDVEVIVLTACPSTETREQREKMLSDVGIASWQYTELVLVPDNKGVAKAEYCRDNKVDILIDDAFQNLLAAQNLSPSTLRLHVV